MDITRVYLIRHGQVVNHHEFRYNGHHDVDITDFGVEQMERLAGFLKAEPIKAVYSSDLKRATKGADILSRVLGLKPTRVPALRELHLGRWEGLTRQEGSALYPEEAHFSFKDLAATKVKGGEDMNDLKLRVVPAIDGIVKRHANECVCIVAHGGVNRVILSDAMGIAVENFFRIEQDYGALNLIDCFDDGIKVVKLLNGGPNQEFRPTELY